VQDVDPADLEGFTQCHFFAGIGGWSYALRLAGWPDDRPVWTGSCPCQPFSVSGKQKGFDDDRHLWPYWIGHIGERRPPVLFGEQVASPDGLKWLDLVSAHLEDLDYAIGAANLCAAGVGAPHIRQRLYWVADDNSSRLSERERVGRVQRETLDSSPRETLISGGDSCRVDDSSCAERRTTAEGRADVVNWADTGREETTSRQRLAGTVDWRNCDWLPCSDGKSRPVEPGTFPLAHGVPARVGRLRGYGNAIVPQVAATFIRAYLEARD
jgi:DNA (cytosine-5)-methyltransferase 1